MFQILYRKNKHLKGAAGIQHWRYWEKMNIIMNSIDFFVFYL